MTPLKTGALALTLIIVIPIMLGYGMASGQVSEVQETSENGGNLTDLILNSSTPYYSPYSGANNNYYLLRSITSQGSTYSVMQTPNYVQTSADKYSYLPVYAVDSQSDYATLPSPTVVNYSDTATIYGTHSGADHLLPSFAIAKLTYELGGSPYYELRWQSPDEEGWLVDRLLDGTDIEVYVTEDGYYHLTADAYPNGTFEEVATDFFIVVNGDLTMRYVDYTTLPNTFPDIWSASVNGDLALRLNLSGGGVRYAGYNDATSIVVSYNTVTVGYGLASFDTFNNVESIDYAQSLGDTVLTIYFNGTTLQGYADVSYGWKLPGYSGVHSDYWFNGFSNNYVRMMIHLEPSEVFQFSQSANDINPYAYISRDSSGNVTIQWEGVETVTLGNYADMMIEIQVKAINDGSSKCTISGISSWPSYGEMPEVHNSRYWTSSNFWMSDFAQIYVNDLNSNSVEIRVDSADIISGYFPSTNGRVFDLYDYYPSDRHQSIVIDSVGVYGEYLTIGGVPRPVQYDGTISVWDDDTQSMVSVKVLGMVIEYAENDSGTEWTTYVNGHKTAVNASAPRLIFGGEWSVTIHRGVISEETVIKEQWTPGAFAFDKDDFILCMILVSVLVFVGLGLMRGVRIGVLAVVCSAAGIIAFMIA